ncbi:hypothetical protein RBH29_11825 [Herbivorax sp. ANBcel31]|uniref:hypothetical protein n=1 Tax=Herbivorax sp. ANBcel31 TaxID=3069754 RepID=UPI0027B3AE0F|nr:hypothetical protein [Herbivorax sp. ANBcel31]MDQ2087114.1 hypothetical protein [Herbivorax sp. ANBcel31]
MFKKLSFLLIIIILTFSVVGCNEINNIELEDKSFTNEKDNEIVPSTKNPVSDKVPSSSQFQELISFGSYTDIIRLGGEHRDSNDVVFNDDKLILPEGKLITVLGETAGILKRFIDVDEDNIRQLIREIENAKVVDSETVKYNFQETIDGSIDIVLINTSAEYIRLSIYLNSKNNHSIQIVHENTNGEDTIIGKYPDLLYLHSEKLGDLIKDIIGWKFITNKDLNNILHVNVRNISNESDVEFELTEEEIKIFIDTIASYPAMLPREYSSAYKNVIIEAITDEGKTINMIWAPNGGGLGIEGVHYQFFFGDIGETDSQWLKETYGFSAEEFMQHGGGSGKLNEILVR